MRRKTSITLSREVLSGIDRLPGARRSRSAVIERVLRDYLSERARAARDARDLELLNKYADELNAEAADVLKDQIVLDGDDDEAEAG